MKTKPVSNPYESPKASGEPTSPVTLEGRWFSGPFPVFVLTCLFVNLLLVFVANFLLYDLFADLEVDLPVLSKVAFWFVRPWFVASAIFLIFAAVTIYAKTLLNTENRRKIFIYSALVTALWFLLTAGLAFAILLPLYAASVALP